MLVTKINEGAISSWNVGRSTEVLDSEGAVQIGDRIVEINGKAGQAMLDFMKNGLKDETQLNIEVRRCKAPQQGVEEQQPVSPGTPYSKAPSFMDALVAKKTKEAQSPEKRPQPPPPPPEELELKK